MRLTNRGRYAVTAMADLAIHSDCRPVSLADIAIRQDIPISFLGQLFMSLREYGLVYSQRGPNGGYRLARDSSEISIVDVINAVDEKIHTLRCGGLVNCQENQQCLTHTLWAAMDHRIRDLFADISISDIVSNAEVLEISARQDAYLAQQQNHGIKNSNRVIARRDL